jgi:hypothetical protein
MTCCVQSGRHQTRGGGSVIEMRRKQLSFGDGLIAGEVSDLREDWMTYADEVLADEEIVAIVYEALAKRHPKSRSRGRRGTPADRVLRLLILKHVRDCSYEVLEREVRANLVYRDFTHVGSGKMRDAKTMARWGVVLGPQVLKAIHERMVKIAQAKGVITGRRMRVDATVVETNILRAVARKMLNAEHYAELSSECSPDFPSCRECRHRITDRTPHNVTSFGSSSHQRRTSAFGGGGRRLLLRQERGCRKGKGRQARLHSQSLNQKP